MCSHLCRHPVWWLQDREICCKWLHINVVTVIKTLKCLRMIQKKGRKKIQDLWDCQLRFLSSLLCLLPLLALSIWNLWQCWSYNDSDNLAGPMTFARQRWHWQIITLQTESCNYQKKACNTLSQGNVHLNALLFRHERKQFYPKGAEFLSNCSIVFSHSIQNWLCDSCE